MDNTKSTPCANSRITGCTESVKSRGNILCTFCLMARDNLVQNRKQQDEQKLLQRIRELETQNRTYTENIKNLENKNNKSEEIIRKLMEEIKNTKTVYKEHIESLTQQNETDRKHLEIKCRLLQLKLDECDIVNNETGTTLKKEISDREDMIKKLTEINGNITNENKKLLDSKIELTNSYNNLENMCKNLQESLSQSNENVLKITSELEKIKSEKIKRKTQSSQPSRLVRKNSKSPISSPTSSPTTIKGRKNSKN